MRWLVAAVAAALLGGCASTWQGFSAASAPSVTGIDERLARVIALSRWQVLGRIAVQAQDKGVTADLDWIQLGGDFALRIMAPLSGGTYEFSGGAGGVTLATPRGERVQATSVEELMVRHLGWSIPVAGVSYWVRGIPKPEARAEQEHFDARGRWTDFVQDGWRISVLDYSDSEGLDLPRKLFLQHQDLTLRLVIKRWSRL